LFSKNDGTELLDLWLAVAVIAPVGSLYVGNWLTALALIIACGSVAWLTVKFGKADNGKLLAGLQCLWLGLLIGKLMPHSLTCWESDSHIIPAALLILAAFGAMHGAERASRVAAVLFGGVIFIVGIILLVGSKNLRINWLMPKLEWVNYDLIPIFLLPCLAGLYQRKREGKICAAIAVPGGVLPLLLGGCLSPQVAAGAINPLYEYSKSVKLFGVAERVEVLVSCAITASWFCLFAWLLTAAGQFVENAKKESRRWGVWGCAAVAVAVYLCNMPISGEMLALGSLLFWVAIPLAAQCFGYAKKAIKKIN